MTAARYLANAAAMDNAREREARAFRHVNALLAAANDTRSRVAALYKTHELWSILLQGLADPANPLPVELKARLASLALWAQREALTRMADDASLEPLMAVHRDMIEALSATPPAARQAETAPPPFVPALA